MAQTIQQLKLKIAEELGIPVEEVPEDAIEQGQFGAGPVVSQSAFQQIQQKKKEDAESLGKLKRIARESGITGKEEPLVNLAGTPIPAPSKPAIKSESEKKPDTESTVKSAISAAVAPTTEQNAGKKVDEYLTRSKEFDQRRQEYLDLMPSGALSKKQVASINEKYESEKEDIENKLAEAKADFEAGRNRLANAELIDTLGKGLVQLMAGIYGANTGRDAVSGVDFRPKDWSSNFANLQRQYNQQYSELKDLKTGVEGARKEELKQAEDVAEKEAARVGAAGRLALGEMKEKEALGREQKRAADAEAKASEADARALRKKLDDAKQALGQLKQAPNKKKRKELESKLSGVLETIPGLDAAAVQEAIESYEPGGLFSNPDYSSLESIIQEIEQTVPSAKPATSPTTDGKTVTIIDKASGASITVPANSKQAKNAQKYPDSYEIKQ